jgi:hypothetical protein
MSLLNTASTWTSKDRRNKRQSTMKKPSLISHDNLDTNENNLMLEGFKTNIPQSIENTQNLQKQRNERINTLINNMDNNEDNDGNHLENFNPLPNPNIHVKKDMPNIQTNNLEYNPNVHEQFSNYTNSYNGEISYKQAQPSSIERRIVDKFGNNDKLLEKINYMIHLLEQQQHEKTENIAEEFILYSFLGIFIIYVVDGFSRSGKYIR